MSTRSGQPYSPNKIFHHREWIDQIRDGGFPPPIFVEIIPTNRCNHNCTFCAYRNSDYNPESDFAAANEIPFTKLAEIVESCSTMGVKAIEVTGGGEPTVHPQFLDFCRLVIDKGLDLGLVTNGTRWTDETTEVLRHAAWVRFSVDAGSAKSYSDIRCCPKIHYSRVRQSIHQLASARGTHQTPIIGVGFVVTKDNWKEVHNATWKAREDGADNIRISAVFQEQGLSYFDSFGEEAAKSCREITTTFTSPKFTVFNLFSDRLNDLYDGRPSYSRCYFQQASSFIGADQKVYRCCVQSYNPIGYVGDLHNRTFKDLWNAEETKNTIWDFTPASCEHCMFNKKNLNMKYATQHNPLHVNFV